MRVPGLPGFLVSAIPPSTHTWFTLHHLSRHDSWSFHCPLSLSNTQALQFLDLPSSAVSSLPSALCISSRGQRPDTVILNNCTVFEIMILKYLMLTMDSCFSRSGSPVIPPVNHFLKNWGKINIKFTILTIFKCTVQYQVHSYCCAIITTIHLQNFFHLARQTLNLLNNNSPFSPLQPLQPPFYLVTVNWTALTSSHEWHQSICPPVTTYFSASMLQHVFKAENILLCMYTIFCLCIHLLMDTWVASTFWLLWIMLLWIWVYKYLFMSLLSIIPRSGTAYDNILEVHPYCSMCQYLIPFMSE